MFLETQTISERVAALAGAACVELFHAYGVELLPTEGGWDSDETVRSGVMGFVGPKLRGTCLLSATMAPLSASCPSGNRLDDWTGELANQLVGRLKTKLIAHGVEVALSTPIVLRGARILPVPRGTLLPSVFAGASGMVLVWVEAEARPDLELSLGAASGEAGAEGDILLF